MLTTMPCDARSSGNASCTSASGATTFTSYTSSQHVERVLGERRLGRRAEHAGVVDQEVEPAEILRRGDEAVAMPAIGHVARNDAYRRMDGEVGGGRFERGRLARVEHEVPPVERQRARECEPEPARSAGHHCNGHRCLLSVGRGRSMTLNGD